jgi:hypothetical protein
MWGPVNLSAFCVDVAALGTFHFPTNLFPSRVTARLLTLRLGFFVMLTLAI